MALRSMVYIGHCKTEPVMNIAESVERA